LESEFGVPVAVTNDVDAGVYGEYRFGAGRSAHTVLGIFPGTGIGGGCVLAGEIVRGSRSSCMEIGHIQVTRDGRLCGCGLRGCLETEASRLAIAAEVAAAAYRGETSKLQLEAGTDVAKIRSGMLADAIQAGDRVVESIVSKAAERLGTAVASIVHLLGPDVVVLGGGLVEAMPELFVRSVRQAANANVMASFVDSFRVEVAQLGDDATILGTAAWAQKRVAEFSESSPAS
jgi:glucokinase